MPASGAKIIVHARRMSVSYPAEYSDFHREATYRDERPTREIGDHHAYACTATLRICSAQIIAKKSRIHLTMRNDLCYTLYILSFEGSDVTEKCNVHHKHSSCRDDD